MDLFVFLRRQTDLPIKPFTQQAILNGLLQTVLSPIVQQRQEEQSCRLRGQLYLLLLSFLTYVLLVELVIAVVVVVVVVNE